MAIAAAINITFLRFVCVLDTVLVTGPSGLSLSLCLFFLLFCHRFKASSS